jgi:hypothetical protein
MVVQPPRLREASLSDYSQITALVTRNGLEVKSEAEWKHLWIENPLYRRMGHQWPIGWVLQSREQDIVGYIGNIPLLYEFRGRPVITAGTYCWVVDEAYRGYSVLLLDRYFDQKYVDLYLSTTVNSQASKAFQVFDSPPVPVGAWDRAAFWVTNYQGFTSSWLNMNEWRGAKALSYPFSAALAIKDRVTRPLPHKNSDGVDIKSLSSFGPPFDRFWKQVRERRSNQLLGVRTSDLLEWHFKYALAQNRVWILTVQRGSSLAAYSIFYRQDNAKLGLTRLRFVDFESLDGDTALLLPMLLYALRRCHREQIHMLEYLGVVPQMAAVIEKLRPHWRKLPAWLYFYKAREAKLAECLAEPKAWNPSWFDGDASL